MNSKNTIPAWKYELQFFWKENKKGIIIILFSIIVVTYFMIGSSSVREKDSKRFKCEANCDIQNIEPNRIIHQDFDGSHVSINSYTVTFYYEVNGISYTNKNVILNNASNRDLISTLYRNTEKRVIVKYKCLKPHKSMITLNIK